MNEKGNYRSPQRRFEKRTRMFGDDFYELVDIIGKPMR